MSEKVAEIGAGTMGSGIALVAVEAGYEVVLIDTDRKFIDRGIGTIKKFLGRKVAKGSLTQEQLKDIERRLSGSTDMKSAVKGAVMVIEAVFEKLELKQDVFRKLDEYCPRQVVLASNTSTLSISTIALATGNPARVIGTHFFSPVPLMRLVEVIRGKETSDAVTEKAMEI